MHKQLFEKLLTPKTKKAYRGWKQGQVPCEAYKGIVPAAGDQVRKAKALLELDIARNSKGYKKSFCMYMGDRRKIRGNVGPL